MDQITLIVNYLRTEDQWRHEYEILFYLINHKKIDDAFFKNLADVDDIKNKENALENLIKNNIVRKT